MPYCRPRKLIAVVLTAVVLISCAPDYRPCLLGGNCRSSVIAGVFSVGGGSFTEVLIGERTFIEGRSVTTVTHYVDDMERQPIILDFNADGKADPVVAYRQGQSGILQILLSYGPVGSVQFTSLTLDGGENQWRDLQDVAVGDIDGDGSLDIVAAAEDGIIYLHHPSDPDRTHVLSEWGQATGELELIEGTTDTLSDDELTAAIAVALGPGANLDNYLVTVEQGYTSLEIADFNNDGHNDIAASRRMHVTLAPKPDVPVQPLEIVEGSIQILLNPGRAVDGRAWTATALGAHERHSTFDREGARDLRAHDVDGDGDLDLISTAMDDQNVQVAWFENPGGPGVLDLVAAWTQHRIGSVRGAYDIDVADVTGDGRVDVIATSQTQMQLVLFVQPAEAATRGYDWFTTSIVDFESFEPRSVRAIDVDNDGTLELVVGGTAGAVRYFEPPALPTDEWHGTIIVTHNPPGSVGRLGYGDLDADGDVDLVTVIDGDDINTGHVTWIRNELIQ